MATGASRCETEEDVDKEIHENIAWLLSASKDEKELLKNYLVNLDRENRVDPDSERSMNVRGGTRDIVETIGRKIAEREPRLRGQIVPMGSAHNGTKVGDSDEFDFVYEIELSALLKRKGSLVCCNENGYIVVKVEGDAGQIGDYLVDVLTLEKCTEQQRLVYTYPVRYCRLGVTIIQGLFQTIIGDVLSELELPPGWCHGGFNRPDFSGLRLQGPSYILQFDYRSTGDYDPLRISVDFVPMIKLEPLYKLPTPEPLHQYLIRETSTEYAWFSLSNKVFGYGKAEEIFFSTFPTKSTSKAVNRICKVVSKLARMQTPRFPTEQQLHEIDVYVKEIISGQGRSYKKKMALPCIEIGGHHDFLLDPDDFCTFSDLNETLGDMCIVKSHTIKTIVFGMMTGDKSQGRDWTEDDLPDLVISIYMVLLNTFRSLQGHYPFEDNFFAEEKVLIPLKGINGPPKVKKTLSPRGENLDKNTIKEDLERMEHVTETHQTKVERLENEQAAPKFYIKYINTNKEMLKTVHSYDGFIENRIASIFQILRCVCEGKDTAEIVLTGGCKETLSYRNPTFKTNCKELLHELNSPSSNFQKIKLR